ncbi:aconitate hydratase [Blattabacterium cuenoti]|uniref:aconitate hydratase n=1 Tax=Blattabacterium cuenoti TaxID=1653831 RepID=UPI00163C4CEA|nr:aconitate hydratase [Blattabacterium cuenoti]
MIFDFNMIKNFYSTFEVKINEIKARIETPMTYSEKILYSHLYDLKNNIIKNYSDLKLMPNRLAMQDATAQMALLQFMQTKKDHTEIITTIHCDHLIQAKDGYRYDVINSEIKNQEIYHFLKSAAEKYGIEFWPPGYGIIHQVLLENYAFPGGLILGTDSHTPNAGGLGMLAIGIGGADAVEVMYGLPFILKKPKIIGVHLSGKLSGWASPKDVILKLAGMIGVSGSIGYIIEYFGKGSETLSCTGKATICNMGAEIGATSSIFPYDDKMEDYLYKSGRKKISEMLHPIKNLFQSDIQVYENPIKYYDKVININLSMIEPHINGPFTPDISIPISNMKKEVLKHNWPNKIEVGLIGSCTNSSYEDFSKAISIIQQAKNKKLKLCSEYLITPGSNIIYYLMKKNGWLSIFNSIGAKIFSSSCGPCIGQWCRYNKNNNNNIKQNTIIHSFNRNFSSRNDGNPNTYAFIASPEIVTALVFSGNLTFNPQEDSIKNANGINIKLDTPKYSDIPIFFKNKQEKLKLIGYKFFYTKKNKKNNISININPTSERLQRLSSFPYWNKKDLLNLRLLIKIKGKCTTDHISMAGSWLKYRGHLENISNNLLIGAINSFNNKNNNIKNVITKYYGTVSVVAKYYKSANIGTVIVGEENYGEGSSREHAAMEPRYLGIRVVLVKSFSRIHEINLKKQGILALTFLNISDYDKIDEDDFLNFFISNYNFKNGKNIKVKLIHQNGCVDNITVKHSYNEEEIKWFEYGSYLNFIQQNKF